jgi:hypothetical protein
MAGILDDLFAVLDRLGPPVGVEDEVPPIGGYGSHMNTFDWARG